MSATSVTFRKLFIPNHHLWIRALPATSLQECGNELHMIRRTKRTNTRIQEANDGYSSNGNDDTQNPCCKLLVDVGFTFRGIEDIGDINTITAADEIQINDEIKAGENIMQIEWDGHVHSEADELYHAVWETFTQTVTMKSPISGKIHTLNCMETSPIYNSIDDETTLFTIETLEEDLEQLLSIPGQVFPSLVLSS